MPTRLKNDLLLINILAALLAVVIGLFPDNFFRIALGLPFLLFFPGYVLAAALFPRKSDLDGIERVGLSFGLSIAVTPLIGLILNYTPWGIRLYPVLISIALFVITLSIIALFRRRALPVVERFGVSFSFTPRFSLFAGASRLDRALSVVLAAAVVGAIATLGYVLAAPKVGERFTEFYILGPGGKAADYPKQVVMGKEAKVTVGLVNREHERVSYRIQLTVDGAAGKELGPIVLDHEGKWEGEAGFVPAKVGDNQKVELLLYMASQAEPYLRLHLWLNVVAP